MRSPRTVFLFSDLTPFIYVESFISRKIYSRLKFQLSIPRYSVCNACTFRNSFAFCLWEVSESVVELATWVFHTGQCFRCATTNVHSVWMPSPSLQCALRRVASSFVPVEPRIGPIKGSLIICPHHAPIAWSSGPTMLGLWVLNRCLDSSLTAGSLASTGRHRVSPALVSTVQCSDPHTMQKVKARFSRE